MNREVFARTAAPLSLLILVILAAVIVLSSCGGATTYTLRIPNAGQLVDGNDVRVGGNKVGSITNLRLDSNDEALIDLKLTDGSITPLPEGTTAAVRAPSVAGIANRFVSLQLGPNSGKSLSDGALIGTDKTRQIVDLDQLFATFDPKTQAGFAKLLRGGSKVLDGSEKQANAAYYYLNPALKSGQKLFAQIAGDEPALKNFIGESAKVVDALANERDAVSGLVSNGRAAAGDVVSQAQALDAVLSKLPGTLRKSNTTLVNTRTTLDALDPLVKALKPATKDLLPLLKDVRPLVKDARPTIADARQLVRSRGADNDLIDVLRLAPKLQKVATPALQNLTRAEQDAQPVAKFVRPYTPELVGWFRDFGQAASNYDANGHFARFSTVFNSSNLVALPRLQPLVDQLKTVTDTLGIGQEVIKSPLRCPGAGTQQRPDKSNVWRDEDGKLDCDPSVVLPGP